MQIYGYCRISTPQQNIERQVRNILTAYPTAHIIREVYTGTTHQGRRELDKLLHTAQAGDAIVFDTMVNTAMEAIDKVRDTSTSHERCSIIEVMGRHAGYIALWCGIANGAEDILLPERYDGNEQMLINRIIDNRKRGKRHHIIINAEGIGHSASMAKRIEAATGIETRATILGYMQRGGAPTCKDRVYASIMGAKAVELLEKGKTNRVVAYKHGEFLDFDIQEALNMKKDIPEDQYGISKLLIR